MALLYCHVGEKLNDLLRMRRFICFLFTKTFSYLMTPRIYAGGGVKGKNKTIWHMQKHAFAARAKEIGRDSSREIERESKRANRDKGGHPHLS